MSEQKPRNITASIHQRLLNESRRSGRVFNELVQAYAMERFLYRLSQSPHAGKFILKGALMLRAWQAPLSRPTMDIDLLGRTSNDIDAIVTLMREICGQQVESDGMVFDAASVSGQAIAEDACAAPQWLQPRGDDCREVAGHGKAGPAQQPHEGLLRHLVIVA